MAAALAALVVLASGASANAAPSFFWPDSYQSPASPAPAVRRAQPRPRGAAQADKLAAAAGKPTGPLIIAISIERQTLKVYDANGFFAETPISSGTRGHPTPMGVFSVIQKHKWHRSNLYSDAPMPYMQRITWSGVALHAGVLPGYPASHGCIRMPTNFAAKLWTWTRTGARVVITPGDVNPIDIEHPLLAAMKPNSATPMATSATAPDVRTADANPSPSTPVPAATLTVASTESNISPVKAAVGVETTSSPRTSVEAVNQPEGPKDQARAANSPVSGMSEPRPAAAPGRNSPIALFVSRKDGRLYARRNQTPLFDVPVAIAAPDQPLGTHVFTARIDKDGARPVQWSVVSLPAIARRTVAAEDEGRSSRRKRAAGAVDVTPAPPRISADEALNRIGIPADVMARLGDALPSGSSIVVSDQGIAGGETGEGTDFIILLR